ncbi:uncharacterized protein LOC119670406 isoform X2 [Teleopsis dalmanni]|uniref:uncharacterized protein LOC119670406 isoform X2 n=1 Tax=Teleopsis dalmanni TaxID=139649 RepID=UPI0018CD6AAE|nr:uncharacterized protein LOC119670406 isoform X2 [Teleopsis dalmanni]
MEELENSFATNAWSRAETIALIQEFRKHPCLYDPSHPENTNLIKRKHSYISIFNKLSAVKTGLSINKIKAKLKILHTQLKKEVKLASLCQKDHGNYRPTLWCYKEISFLRDFIKYQPKEEYLENVEDNTMSLEDNDSKNFPLLTMSSIDSHITESLDEMSEDDEGDSVNTCSVVDNVQQNHVLSRLNVVDSFCKYLCTELQRVHEEQTLDDLKLQILILVRNAIKKEKNVLQNGNH